MAMVTQDVTNEDSQSDIEIGQTLRRRKSWSKIDGK